MALQSVTVTAARVLSDGNYGSYRFEAGATWELDAGEDEALVLAGLWKMVRANVRKQLQPYTEADAEKAAKILLGFPPEVRAALAAQVGAVVGEREGP